MPAPTSTLTNCYTPLHAPVKPSPSTNDKSKSLLPRIRNINANSTNETKSENDVEMNDPDDNHRDTKQFRRVFMDCGILSNADGSALVEIGQTKILCAVHGPRSLSSSSSSETASEFHSEGVLHCDIRYAPHFGVKPETIAFAKTSESVGGGGNSHLMSQGGGGGVAASAEEVELSARVHDAIVSSVPLGALAKSVLDVHVMVLQSDGAVLSSCIACASLALADAGVELYDLVSCCSVALVDIPKKSVCLADPTEEELLASSGVVTLAMLSNLKEVTLWDQTGTASLGVTTDAIEMCRDGCSTMHKFMRQCLVTKQTPAN
mmetsp:Transcript_46309/g.68314  ORF Transcript_46309/g.68314 Transcript_46309/m.68314 type:complete len:320 (-) Transcript_46309:94-1053(-)|eukprot:CAMPEP_0195538124 /NCGR_PEP_ID=MMETSP0794_2-20130614/49254_1 /TAXON_ID=515487 /ORGANISM="Stephanopyxis turris, Strain CCMP 815" /LENGTH=319 /DNA_ID=CAMNT_0040672071 /DNA_START=1 /DNA_END=963 /DNA_ORIENTATION=+